MAESKRSINLTSLDDLFSTEKAAPKRKRSAYRIFP